MHPSSPRANLTRIFLAASYCVSVTLALAQLPPFDWMRTASERFQFGAGRGVAIDADGNCFMVGTVRDGADFDGTILNTRDNIDLFVAKYAPDGHLLWVKNAGGLNPNAAEEDAARGIDVDALGNCYVAGEIGDSAFFDATTVLVNGYADVFVAKYDPDGDVIWVERAGSSEQDRMNDIVVNDAGDSYVTGSLGGAAADFGDAILANAAGDGFLAKYDSGGSLQWVRLFTGTAAVVGSGLALTPAGDCIVVGMNYGTATIGDSVFTSTGISDGFIAKFDAGGGFEWATQSNPPNDAIAAGVDEAGLVYIVGDYYDAFFDRHGLYMAKYAGDGQYLWADTILASGGLGTQVRPLDIAVMDDGRSVTTGWFDQQTTFGGSTFTPVGGDAFIIARDSTGTITDAMQGGNGPVVFNAVQSGRAIDVDEDGNVLVQISAHEAIAFADTTWEFSGEHRYVLVRLAYQPTGILPIPSFGVALSQNVPNPFNPATVLRYHLLSTTDVRLEVFNVEGRHVRTLVRDRLRAGAYSVVWDGRSDTGSSVATGVYFYRLQAGATTLTRRMVLLK